MIRGAITLVREILGQGSLHARGSGVRMTAQPTDGGPDEQLKADERADRIARQAKHQTRRQGDKETRRMILSPCLLVSLSPCLGQTPRAEKDRLARLHRDLVKVGLDSEFAEHAGNQIGDPCGNSTRQYQYRIA